MVAGWPAQKRSWLRGSPAASMGREDPAPGKELWGSGPDGGAEGRGTGADGEATALRPRTPAEDARDVPEREP